MTGETRPAIAIAPSSVAVDLISRQTLVPHSETAITPSSVAIDLKGGVPTRICPQLPLSGFRRDGPQSLPHRAEQSLPHQSGLTRAGKSISSEERGMAVSSIRGGEKMERAIRLGARTTTPRSRQTLAPQQSLTLRSANARSSLAFDLPQSRLTPLGTARN